MQFKIERLFTFICLIMLPFLMQAQQKSKNSVLFRQASREYTSLRYASAIPLLERVLKSEPDQVEAKEMLANSFRKIKNYERAAHWYGQLSKEQNVKPEWALGYAEVLANLKDYSGSDHWYQQYLKPAASDKRAADFASVYPAVGTFMADRRSWKISYTDINTAASEYAPAFYNGGLIFSSNRSLPRSSKHIFQWDQTPFTDLYYVEKADIKDIDPDSVLKNARNNPSLLKKIYKDNDDDTYRTSNDSRVLGTLSSAIRRDTLGKALSLNAKVKPVQGFVNSKYHEGPAVVLPDGSLLFTRNNYQKGRTSKSREGINKLKLYTALAPAWDQVEAFPFNSNEYSTGHPAINKRGTVLILASDMPGGFGGVDLYYCQRTDAKAPWTKPVNLGPLVNTEGDEMFPSIAQDSILFFASTGHAGLGGLDIFQIGLNGVSVHGKPLNLGFPVNSSVDDLGIVRSEDGNTGYFTSNRRGSDDIYSFVHKDFHLSTDGLSADTTLTVFFKLERPGLNCDSLKQQLASFIIYYDLDKSFIRADASKVMERLALFLKGNPAVDVIAASHCDSRASNSYNIGLSLRRSQSARRYLIARGIAAERIKIQYFGENKLLNKCLDDVKCPEPLQQLNRRTEFYLNIEGTDIRDVDCSLLPHKNRD